MRVLRVCLTYPHDITPGIGLPCYYHAMYSNHEEMIITRKSEGVKFPMREGVRIVEVLGTNTALGNFKGGVYARMKALLKKINEQRSFLKQAKSYIKEFKPDIVHVYTPMPIMIGIWCRKKFGVKYVMSLHGTDVVRIKSSRLFNFCLESPDAVVTVGRTKQEEFSYLKLRRPIESIGNGVDNKTFANTKQRRKNQFVQVASLRWQKGQNYLFDAFGKFHEEYPEYKLVMIGEGEDKSKLQEQASKGGYLDAVDFKGMLSREKVAEILNQSKVFVLSSVSEGFPKVVIEAMATGTPVISTDVGNVPEVVQNSGIIVPSKNVEALYEAMKKMTSSEEQWMMCSQLSEEYANVHTWESVENRLNAVYKEVLES